SSPRPSRRANERFTGRAHLPRMSLGAASLAAFALTLAGAAAAPAVPWLDQRPVKAVAHPPLAPPCRARDLHAHLFLQGATGPLVGGVDLTNAGNVAVRAARPARRLVHRAGRRGDA